VKNKTDKIKSIIAGFLLTPAFLAMIGFLWAFSNDYASLQARVKVVEKKQVSNDKKIDQMHWFLIKRNNVRVPENVK